MRLLTPKTTRRTVASLLLAAVTLTPPVLAISPNAADATQVVTWWCPNWDESTPSAPLPSGELSCQQLAAQFDKRNPGYKVSLTITTWATMAAKIATTLNAGVDVPDVIQELTARAPNYMDKDQLLNVTSWFTNKGPLQLKDFVPGPLEEVSRDGKIYSVPYRWDDSALIYNKTMFKQAGLSGPPTTWAQLVSDAKALTKNGVQGIGWPLGDNGNAADRFVDQYYADGGVPQGAGGHTVINTKIAARALGQIAATFTDGSANKESLELNDTSLRELFTSKRIAMYFGGPYDVVPDRTAGIDVGTAVYPGPHGPADTSTSAVSADGFVLMVPRKAPDIAGAKRLVDFLGSTAGQAHLTNTFPARESSLSLKRFSTPGFGAFKTELAHALYEPYPYVAGNTMQAMYDGLQKVVLGSASPAQAAGQIEAAARAQSA